MTRPAYGRFSEAVNTPTEILASNEGMEKIGVTIDNTAAAVAASMTTSGGNANSHLTFTAKEAGVIGNQLAVVITDTDQAALTVSVADGVLTIDLETDTGTPVSTATEVAAAVMANATAAALFNCVVKAGETGEGVVAAKANAHLTGGSDADPAAKMVKGTILARITASGLYTAYDDDGTDDGRRTAVGILVDDIDPAKTSQDDLTLNASMYVRGSFTYSHLTGLDANAITDLNARYIAGADLLLL